MKCANPNCDGEWNSARGKNLTLCPFCQEPVAEEKKTPPSFDHVADTLIYIKEQYGVDMLLGKNVAGRFAGTHVFYDCGGVRPALWLNL